MEGLNSNLGQDNVAGRIPVVLPQAPEETHNVLMVPGAKWSSDSGEMVPIVIPQAPEDDDEKFNISKHFD